MSDSNLISLVVGVPIIYVGGFACFAAVLSATLDLPEDEKLAATTMMSLLWPITLVSYVLYGLSRIPFVKLLAGLRSFGRGCGGLYRRIRGIEVPEARAIK